MAVANETIPAIKLTVNTANWFGDKTFGNTMMEANQAADKLVNNPDETRSVDLAYANIDTNLANNWIKVKYLKPGQQIMTVDGFETIKSITKLGREPVFDIQIANTHNFVGNGIVAHNTTTGPTSVPPAGGTSGDKRGRILGILGLGLVEKINSDVTSYCEDESKKSEAVCVANEKSKQGLLFASEQYLNLINNLTWSGLLPEGNPMQVSADFQVLLQKAILDRPGGIDQQIFTYWVMENGGAYYAKSQGWNLSAKFINHFLYGNGQPLDISNDYYKMMKPGFSDVNSQDEFYPQLLQEFFNQRKNFGITDLNKYVVRTTKNGEMTFITQINETDLPKGVLDMSYSLHFHRLEFSAKNWSVTENGEYDLVTFPQGINISVWDKYDFDPSQINGRIGMDGTKSLGEYVNKYIITDAQDYANWYQSLPKSIKGLFGHFSPVALSDQQLQDVVKAGFGKEFEINGSVVVSSPVTIKIDKTIWEYFNTVDPTK
ncbi:MAG: Hint domain-containing protein [Patescibacteria group bacterium]